MTEQRTVVSSELMMILDRETERTSKEVSIVC